MPLRRIQARHICPSSPFIRGQVRTRRSTHLISHCSLLSIELIHKSDFNPNDDDIQYLLKDRSSKALSNDLDKTGKAFPIEPRTGPQLPQYNFIIKTRLSSAEEDHNLSIR